MVQGEFFREVSVNYNLNALDNRARKSFLSQHQFALTLDKVLLALIGILVVFVLTYSFGVEHGKQVMEKHLQALLPTHSETFPVANQESASVEKKEEAILMVKDTSSITPTTTSVASDEKTALDTEASSNEQSTSEAVKSANSLPSVDLTKQGAYTVQLVTYDNESLAAKEIGRLKSKGHEGFVIMSGRYFQVCANYFESHTKARNFLKQFRENGRYPDAFIRPVVR